MKLIRYLFLVVSVIEIAFEFIPGETIHYITKPLLMPTLILFYKQSLDRKLMKIDWLLISAWMFSWVGDVALMFPGENINYFLTGLVAFLITHLLYIASFSMVKDKNPAPILKKKIWVLLPLVAYLGVIISLVFPAVKPDMQLPIVVYTSVIGTMVVFSVNRYKRVSDSSFALVFLGAILFMISDSLIAVNKFLCHDTLFLARFWIMSLYIAGQYLIAAGMLKNENPV